MGDPGVQESSRRGLSTFLADHEDCGRGFDIQRRQGTDGSIVRVICGGCGVAIEYPAAAATDMPEEHPPFRSVSRLLNRDRRESPPPAPTRERKAPPPAKDTRPRKSVRPVGEPALRPLGLPSWLSVPLITATICGGLLLVVLGLASNSGTSDGTPDNEGESLTSVPLTTSSVPLSRAPVVKLDRRRIAERVSIGIPAGWSAGISGGAVTVAARNGRSQVQVYFEQGTPDGSLTGDSRRFLLQRHPGARVADSGNTSLGGRSARTITVSYPGGTESATILVAGGYTYLILARLGKPATPALRQSTDAVVESFRPA